MKIITNNIRVLLFLMVLVLGTTLAACKGPEGPVGPHGPQGLQGPQGDQGGKGDPGNANVTQYNFGAFDHAGTELHWDFNLSKATFEKSFVLVYVKTTNNFWYLLPGYVTGSFEYRIYFRNLSTSTTRLYMSRVTGTGTQSFSALRILVVPAETVVKVKANIDWSNYKEVAAYFQISESL